MNYYAEIAVQIMFLIMLAASFNILFSYAGQVSMAHSAFFGIGAYAAGRATLPVIKGVDDSGILSGFGTPLIVALVIAGMVAFVIGLLIALPALSRVAGDYLILMTIAFQLIINQLMNALDGVTGGSYGLKAIPPLRFFGVNLSQPTKAIWLIFAATIIVVYITHRLSSSPFGRLLRGIREHDSAVRAIGKNTVIPKIVAFGFAGSLAAVAGGLNGAYYQLAIPNTFDLSLSILVFSVVVLGGSGNLIGTVIAAIFLTLLKPIMQAVAGDAALAWQGVAYGLALILMVRFRPQGLLPEGVGWRQLIARFRALDVVPSPHVGQLHLRARMEVEDTIALQKTVNRTEELEHVAVLTIEGLSKHFGGVKAVQDVSFRLPENLITGLLGPNGAGKTTVFNLITNAIKPDGGSIHLKGRDISQLSTVQIAQAGMARSFQDGRLFHKLSALDNVAIAVPQQLGESVRALVLRPVASARRERIVREKALEALGFVGLVDSANKIVGDMSFGDQKLVAIARLIATECDVLLLDEPTAGVDPSAVESVITTVRDLRNLGKTICLVEHSVHLMGQLADHIVFMDQGRVVEEGTLNHLMQQKHLMEIYFGT